MLFLLFYASSVGGFSKMLHLFSNEQYSVKGGVSKICQRLANKVGKENILLNLPVNNVVQVDKKVKLQKPKFQFRIFKNYILGVGDYQNSANFYL